MERKEIFEKLKTEGKLGEIANATGQPEMHLDALLVVYYLSKLVELGMLEFEGLNITEGGTKISEHAIEAGWKLSKEHVPHLLHSLHVSPMDLEPLGFMVLEVEEHGKDGVRDRAEKARKEIDAELSVFSEEDWKNFHDTLREATGLSIDSDDHLKMIYLKLPNKVKSQVIEKGMTSVRDLIIEQFKDFEK